MSVAKPYDAQETESRWYDFWETSGFFRASDAEDDARPAYTIVIPPPNVTGSLHMGHASRATFEDFLVRRRRMQGYNALMLPGIDHAGIATQVVVERQLKAESITRHELGREAFVQRVWTWKAESGGTILRQLRKLGASCDWSRERFTMDPGPSAAVREAFVRLHEEQLLYRATRLINWCMQCRTALSDLEVENSEIDGELFDFAYMLDDESGEIVVSTTRPETMLGDTAIAVHPDDERYKKFHGKKVQHPFLPRKIPIITDAVLVDPKFGTGVVKVTPAHDPNDFATGKRHNLDEINLMEVDGKLNANAGPFQGLDRFEARKRVIAALEERGLARSRRGHRIMVPRCQRCNTIVEPLISTQWFLKMEPLAAPAIEAVETGRIQVIPEEWKATYFHWMRNIQDWCVSRQLWWGHPIPAWYCGKGHVTVARETPKSCAECGDSQLRADEDVLDTWFSSALWPFSTLGWPEKTLDLARFYPTSDMETGYDILFFWVARMIMMGLHFMNDVPFRRVLLSGLVTDERGEKMSKVKGNVIDPLDVIQGATLEQLIEKAKRGGARDNAVKYLTQTYPEGFAAYGADALRCTLLSYSPLTHRIALSIKRVEGYRNFCNKLWNAARYTQMKLDEAPLTLTKEVPATEHLANRWILSRLHATIEHVNAKAEEYRLDEALLATYHFVWDDFCDWYLEITKPLFASEDPARKNETRAVLAYTLEVTLRLLHPMMPFITEEIWQRVPKASDSPKTVMLARYPEAKNDARRDDRAEGAMQILQAFIVHIRTIRAEHEVPRSQKLEVIWSTSNAETQQHLEEGRELIESLAGCTLVPSANAGTPDSSRAAAFMAKDVQAWVPNVVNVAKEKERLQREIGKLTKELEGLRKKLSNQDFIARAPAEVVAEQKQRLDELTAREQQIRASLDHLG